MKTSGSKLWALLLTVCMIVTSVQFGVVSAAADDLEFSFAGATTASLSEKGYTLSKTGDGVSLPVVGEGPNGSTCIVLEDDVGNNGPWFTTPVIAPRLTGPVQADFRVFVSGSQLDVSFQAGGAVVGGSICRVRFKPAKGGATGTFMFFGDEDPKKAADIQSPVTYNTNQWYTLRITADITDGGTCQIDLIGDDGVTQTVASGLPVRRPASATGSYADRISVQCGAGTGTSYVENILVRRLTEIQTEKVEDTKPVATEYTQEDKLKDTTVLFVDSNIALVSGDRINIDASSKNVRPYVENGRTLVPLRFLSESMGAVVLWDEATEGITIKRGGNVTKMNIGKQDYTVNGEARVLDVVPCITDDRTIVPLRAVAESIDARVFWDDHGLIVVSEADNTFCATADKALINNLIGYFSEYLTDEEPFYPSLYSYVSGDAITPDGIGGYNLQKDGVITFRNQASWDFNLNTDIVFSSTGPLQTCDNEAGVVFRCDNGRYYAATLDGARQKFVLYMMDGERRTDLAEADMPIQIDVNYVLRVATQGEKIYASVYNRRKIDEPMMELACRTQGDTFIQNEGFAGLKGTRTAICSARFSNVAINIAPHLWANRKSGYIGNDKIVLSTFRDAVIHYTTDGSIPDVNSPVYTEPIILDGPDGSVYDIKAVAVWNGRTSFPYHYHYTVSKGEEALTSAAGGFVLDPAGRYSFDGNGMKITAGKESEVTTWYGDKQFGDTTVSMDIAFSSYNRSELELTYYVYYASEKDNCSIRFIPASATMALYVGQTQMVSSVALNLNPNEPYHLEATLKDGVLEAELFDKNGKSLRGHIWYDDNIKNKHGKVGYVVKNGGTAGDESVTVSNFKINWVPDNKITSVGSYAPSGKAYCAPYYASYYTEYKGANIRYTLDGSVPTAASALYNGSVRFEQGNRQSITLQPERDGVMLGSPVTYTYDVLSPEVFNQKVKTVSSMPPFKLVRDYETTFQSFPILDFDRNDPVSDLMTKMEACYDAGYNVWCLTSNPDVVNGIRDILGWQIDVADKLYEKTGKRMYVQPQFPMTDAANRNPEQIAQHIKNITLQLGHRDGIYKFNGKLYFRTFNGDYFTPSQWQRVYDIVRADPDMPEDMKDFYVMVDMNRFKTAGGFNSGVYQEYLDAVDGAYLFGGQVGVKEPNSQLMLNGKNGRLNKTMVIVSLENTYWRVETDVIRSYNGYSNFCKEWRFAADHGFDGASASTWDDYGENTMIEPNHHYSYTTAQISRYFNDYLDKGYEQAADYEAIFAAQTREILAGDSAYMQMIGLKRTTPTKYAVMALEDPYGNIVYQSEEFEIPNHSYSEKTVYFPTTELYRYAYVRPRYYVSDAPMGGNLPETYYLGYLTRINRSTHATYVQYGRMIGEMQTNHTRVELVPKNGDSIPQMISGGIGTYLSDDVKGFDVNIGDVGTIRDVSIYRGAPNEGDSDMYLRDYRVFTYGEQRDVPAGMERHTVKILWGGLFPRGKWNGYAQFAPGTEIPYAWGDLLDGDGEDISIDGNKVSWISTTVQGSNGSANQGWDGVVIDVIGDPDAPITVAFEDTTTKPVTFTMNDLKNGTIYTSPSDESPANLTICLSDKSATKRSEVNIDVPESFYWERQQVEGAPIQYYYVEVETDDHRFYRSAPIFVQTSSDISMSDNKIFDDQTGQINTIKILNIEKAVTDFDFTCPDNPMTGIYRNRAESKVHLVSGGNVLHRTNVGNASFHPEYLKDEGCIRLDGIDDYVLGQGSTIPLSAVSIEMEIRLHKTKNNQNLLTQSNAGYRVKLNSKNQLVINRTTTNGSTGKLVSKQALSLDQWHNIKIVSDLSTMYLYIDGVLDSQISTQARIRNGLITLGKAPTASNSGSFDIRKLKITAGQ